MSNKKTYVSERIPFFSIIVAVYNGDKYISECIDSILIQTYENFELIIVDDGSTDTTLNVCENYAMKDSRITVIHQQNSGQTLARLKGIEKATGKYISVVDADDWVESTYLQILYTEILKCYPDIVSINYYVVQNKDMHKLNISGVKTGYYSGKQLEEIRQIMIYDRNSKFYTFGVFPTLWSKVFKRELILKCMKRIDTTISIGEDALCIWLSICEADNILFISDSLYYYRINPCSLTNVYKKNNFEKFSVLSKQLSTLLPSKLLYSIKAYKLYMLIGCITNECRGEKPINEVVDIVKHYCELPQIKECIQKFEISKMDKKKKAVWFFLRCRFYKALIIILRMLKV